MNYQFPPYYRKYEFIREWPFNTESFDKTATLSASEKELLTQWHTYWSKHRMPQRNLLRKTESLLDRFLRPLDAALSFYGGGKKLRLIARGTILNYMFIRQTSFWAWNEQEWIEIIGTTAEDFRIRYAPDKGKSNHSSIRHCLIACAYLLGTQVKTLVCQVKDFRQIEFALHIFGTTVLGNVFDKITTEIDRLGIGPSIAYTHMPRVISESLLLNRSPRLEDVSYQTVQQMCVKYKIFDKKRDIGNACITFANILHGLGIISQSIQRQRAATGPKVGVLDNIPLEWRNWIQRWYNTATSAISTRNGNRVNLGKAARWVSQNYPEVTGPAQWTREICAAYVAEVARMNNGDWIHPHTQLGTSKIGNPLSASSKNAILSALRKFFFDCQNWGWIPTKFNTNSALSTPRRIKNAITTNPRVIANDFWAKLIHAGLNLTREDLPTCSVTPNKKSSDEFKEAVWYPFEMVKAITIVWLFSGLRSDEIRRLRVGCIRWQAPEGLEDIVGNQVNKSICLLNVPINKTSNAFVKPVDPLIGQSVQIWEKLRPDEVARNDSKTGEKVHFLFSWRGKTIGSNYLNMTIIPMLCKKAGVPLADAMGNITSHRARSTIATQLYNAPDGMTLFELQEWLGHGSPASTQHYAKITPLKLARAYSKADFFKVNTRMIQVLVDQDAIRSGAGEGDPLLYYDLTHGYCTLPSFNTCAHRMACARCDFYRPKESSYIQLLEAKSHNLRFQQEIPLTDEESLAVEGDMKHVEKLINRLQDVPTPQGPTPRELMQSISMPSIKKRRQNPK